MIFNILAPALDREKANSWKSSSSTSSRQNVSVNQPTQVKSDKKYATYTLFYIFFQFKNVKTAILLFFLKFPQRYGIDNF